MPIMSRVNSGAVKPWQQKRKKKVRFPTQVVHHLHVTGKGREDAIPTFIKTAPYDPRAIDYSQVYHDCDNPTKVNQGVIVENAEIRDQSSYVFMEASERLLKLEEEMRRLMPQAPGILSEEQLAACAEHALIRAGGTESCRDRTDLYVDFLSRERTQHLVRDAVGLGEDLEKEVQPDTRSFVAKLVELKDNRGIYPRNDVVSLGPAAHPKLIDLQQEEERVRQERVLQELQRAEHEEQQKAYAEMEQQHSRILREMKQRVDRSAVQRAHHISSSSSSSSSSSAAAVRTDPRSRHQRIKTVVSAARRRQQQAGQAPLRHGPESLVHAATRKRSSRRKRSRQQQQHSSSPSHEQVILKSRELRQRTQALMKGYKHISSTTSSAAVNVSNVPSDAELLRASRRQHHAQHLSRDIFLDHAPPAAAESEGELQSTEGRLELSMGDEYVDETGEEVPSPRGDRSAYSSPRRQDSSEMTLGPVANASGRVEEDWNEKMMAVASPEFDWNSLQRQYTRKDWATLRQEAEERALLRIRQREMQQS